MTESSVITNCVAGISGAAVRPLVVCFGHGMYSRVLSSKPAKSEAALSNIRIPVSSYRTENTTYKNDGSQFYFVLYNDQQIHN
jgi:hypothetical protein